MSTAKMRDFIRLQKDSPTGILHNDPPPHHHHHHHTEVYKGMMYICEDATEFETILFECNYHIYIIISYLY